MNVYLASSLIGCAALLASPILNGQILLGTDGYSQNFNGVLSGAAGLHPWVDNTTVSGWYTKTVGTTNSQYRSTNGSNQTPRTGAEATSIFSFRVSAPENEAALGVISNNNYQGMIGAWFTNDTGATITSVTIEYTGEQWVWGTGPDLNALRFSISTDATNLTDGTWTNHADGDFVALYSNGSGAGLNGGSSTIFNGSSYVAKTADQAGGPGAPNYRSIVLTISDLSIGSGESLWIRWADDFSGTGVGQGLAIDNFNISVVAVPEASSVSVLLASCIIVLVVSLRRRSQRV